MLEVGQDSLLWSLHHTLENNLWSEDRFLRGQVNSRQRLKERTLKFTSSDHALGHPSRLESPHGRTKSLQETISQIRIEDAPEPGT